MNPSRSTRATKYDYPKLLNGKFNSLSWRKHRFTPGDEPKVAKSILAMARRENWCVVCRVVTDRMTGDAYVEVWGDMTLGYDDPPPAEIEKKLRDKGYDFRKRRKK